MQVAMSVQARLSLGWARRIQDPTTTARSVMDRATGPVPDGVRLVRNAEPTILRKRLLRADACPGWYDRIRGHRSGRADFHVNSNLRAGTNTDASANDRVVSDHHPRTNHCRFSYSDVASDSHVITEICALINLCYVADFKIVACSYQFVQCDTRPDLRILTN